MKKILSRTKKLYLSTIILIAAAGSILFFPMNIGGEYTCFYHRIFDHSHPVLEISVDGHHQEGISNTEKTGNYDLTEKADGEGVIETSHHGSELLDNYLQVYAFPWWVSIGVLAFCVYLLLKLKRKIVGNDSSLNVNQ